MPYTGHGFLPGNETCTCGCGARPDDVFGLGWNELVQLFHAEIAELWRHDLEKMWERS